uniref:Cryptochrome DASH n=1 Tax=Lingulaulax polyedra TaxID=160621 RepID=A0A516AGF4_LINPO|nr:cryptochrome DASH [Lingulodinium polyedra]|mmetsp:Transcript_43665/g.139112  ORF Transcript_43665/g.139112 Transcript_43665/m.139112 type:complete len:569 (+) Transcript_43665:180-1886(+)
MLRAPSHASAGPKALATVGLPLPITGVTCIIVGTPAQSGVLRGRGARATTVLAAIAGRLSRRRGARGAPKRARAATALVWFRTDLRVDDNPTLGRAVELMGKGHCVAALPVYVLDPLHFCNTPLGSPKTGAFRAKFVLECLEGLKQQLRGLGSELLVLTGPTEKRLAELSERVGAAVVLTEQQVADEERRMDQRVRAAIAPLGADLEEVWGNTLYHLADLPFSGGLRNLPNVFTPFKEKCERQAGLRPPAGPPARGSLPLPAASLPELGVMPSWADLPFAEPVSEPTVDPRSAFRLRGGEAAAAARLKHYLWDTDRITEYFKIRNGMLGSEYSTKLSASLAQGCISARRIQHEVARYERERTKNKSTYWVTFELIWRDFFRFFAMKHGNRIFQLRGTAGIQKQWSTDPEALQRWKDGTTGWPLVDANMRELKETGWMSNRGRQNVASYLALDLKLDWRAGADHFESLLVDYDVTSNWGNWVAAAGLSGGRVNKFNLTKQAKDYDASGEYVRTWVPELKGLRGRGVHEPWALGPAQLERLGAAEYPSRLTAADVAAADPPLGGSTSRQP